MGSCLLHILLVAVLYGGCLVSAATYSVDEDGSLQAEGYNVNTIFGNLTAASELSVDGGRVRLHNAERGTTVLLKDNETSSIVFGSERNSAQELLRIDTNVYQEQVLIQGKLKVLGTLDLAEEGSAAKLKNIVLGAQDPQALNYLVQDTSARVNITSIDAATNSFSGDFNSVHVQVNSVVWMSAEGNPQLHNQYWKISNVSNDRTKIKLSGVIVSELDQAPNVYPIGSLFVRPTKSLASLGTQQDSETFTLDTRLHVSGQSIIEGSTHISGDLAVVGDIDTTWDDKRFKLAGSSAGALKFVGGSRSIPIRSIVRKTDNVFVTTVFPHQNFSANDLLLFTNVDCAPYVNTRMFHAEGAESEFTFVVNGTHLHSSIPNCSKSGAVRRLLKGTDGTHVAAVVNGSVMNVSTLGATPSSSNYVVLNGIVSTRRINGIPLKVKHASGNKVVFAEDLMATEALPGAFMSVLEDQEIGKVVQISADGIGFTSGTYGAGDTVMLLGRPTGGEDTMLSA